MTQTCVFSCSLSIIANQYPGGKVVFYHGLINLSCLLGLLVGPYYATILISKGYTFTNICDYVSVLFFTLIPIILYLLKDDDKEAEKVETENEKEVFSRQEIPLALASFLVMFSTGLKESIL